MSFLLMNLRHWFTGQEFRGSCASNNPMIKNQLGECRKQRQAKPIFYYLAVLVWINNPRAKAKNTIIVNPRINIIKI